MNNLLFAALILASKSYGHGIMTIPAPRGVVNFSVENASTVNPIVMLTENGEIIDVEKRDDETQDFRCRGLPSNKDQAPTVLTAGDYFALKVNFLYTHPGDCSLYLAAPDQDFSSPSPPNWYRIIDIPGCGATGIGSGAEEVKPNSEGFTIPIKLPADIPSGRTILRWEWSIIPYDKKYNKKVQFYATCSDIEVLNEKKIQKKVNSKSIVTIYDDNKDGRFHLSTNFSDYWNAIASGNTLIDHINNFEPQTPLASFHRKCFD